jgi:hypothetical protein
MVGTMTHFTKQKAPCGRMVNGDHHVEGDEDGFAYDDLRYACGCRQTRHVYHDGTTRFRTVRHDGKILKDERCGEHETFEA